MDYVTDAHAILWHLFAPRRLGSAAQHAFQSTDAGASHILVPAVVVAEMIMVAERGRLPGVSVPQVLAELAVIRASTNYTLLALLPETVVASHTLTAIPDIFDRLIVAEARRLSVPIISRDGPMRASGLVSLIWD